MTCRWPLDDLQMTSIWPSGWPLSPVYRFRSMDGETKTVQLHQVFCGTGQWGSRTHGNNSRWVGTGRFGLSGSGCLILTQVVCSYTTSTHRCRILQAICQISSYQRFEYHSHIQLWYSKFRLIRIRVFRIIALSEQIFWSNWTKLMRFFSA